MSMLMIDICIKATVEDADDFGRRMKAFAGELEGIGAGVVKVVKIDAIDRMKRDGQAQVVPPA